MAFHKEGTMSNPPSTKHKSSFTITMPVDNNLPDGQEQISPGHLFDGLVWRLRVARAREDFGPDNRVISASIACDEDGSQGLWRSEEKIGVIVQKDGGSRDIFRKFSPSFASWKRDSNKCEYRLVANEFDQIEIGFSIETERESFVRRPVLNSTSNHDVILVLEGQKFPANKQELSSQSRYFNNLFFSGFKESKQKEIEIKDANPEDFDEVIKLMYGTSTEPITVENVTRYLTMADMFDLEIVKEQVENALLSTDLISIHRKFLIADLFKLEVLKNEVLRLYKKKENLLSVKKSPEFAEFPNSVKILLLDFACDLLE